MPNLPYDKYSLYGHFTQITAPKPWEKTNKVAEIKKLI
jgi:S-adenosylmethionine synthetase